MEVGPIPDTGLSALAFTTPELGGRRLAFLGREYGFLLCVGLTEAELAFARAHGSDALLGRLRAAGVLPYTDGGRSTIAGL